MRHSTRTASFGRPFKQRVWLMRNLLVSLIDHERIHTTVAKAKELRRFAERAVTLGKGGSLANRRLLMARLPNENAVSKMFSEIAPRFKDRNGGYTRIIRTGRRPGDNADMAFIEFLDAKLNKADGETKKSAKKAKKSAKSLEKKAAKSDEGGTAKTTKKKTAKASETTKKKAK